MVRWQGFLLRQLPADPYAMRGLGGCSIKRKRSRKRVVYFQLIALTDLDGITALLRYPDDMREILGLVSLSFVLAIGCSLANAPADPEGGTGTTATTTSDAGGSTGSAGSTGVAGEGGGTGGGEVGPAPIVENDAETTDEDTQITVDVLANDMGGNLTLTDAWTDAMGGLEITDNKIGFDPRGAFDALAPNEAAVIDIEYEAENNGAKSNGKLELTINGVNDKPVVVDQMLMANGELKITLSGSDVDSTDLSFSPHQPPNNGTLSKFVKLSPTTAQVTYTPTAFGIDAFTFYANDGVENSELGTITIDVATPPIDLGPGQHTINTDTGKIDNILWPGFDGKVFFVADFAIQANATLVASGSQPLIIESSGKVLIAGTLDASGGDAIPHSGGCSATPTPPGVGGPGGFDGGVAGGPLPGSGTEDGGHGQGPGGAQGGIISGDAQNYANGGFAGHVKSGASGSATPGGTPGQGGKSYNSLPPLIGGSGGGGSSVEKDDPAGKLGAGDDVGGGGGGGGGAVQIVAKITLVVTGMIDASGGEGTKGQCSGYGGGGSGGAIELTSPGGGPDVQGTLNVLGGGNNGGSTKASSGRTLLTKG